LQTQPWFGFIELYLLLCAAFDQVMMLLRVEGKRCQAEFLEWLCCREQILDSTARKPSMFSMGD
jgi:hypothetical protein